MGKVIVNRIQETYTEVTEERHSIFGESEIYQPFTNNLHVLYRSLQKDYGRCIGKLFRDCDDQTLVCGWVFEKREKYEDTEETFLQHTWVNVEWGYDLAA